jgi:hypothetical protein
LLGIPAALSVSEAIFRGLVSRSGDLVNHRAKAPALMKRNGKLHHYRALSSAQAKHDRSGLLVPAPQIVLTVKMHAAQPEIDSIEHYEISFAI